MSIARFFHKLGIPAYHQGTDPPAAAMTPYNFKNPPAWAAGYITKKCTAIKKQGDPCFESSWGIAHYIFLMSLEFPEADFLILLRNPIYACNSLRAFGRSRHSRNIDEVALLYNQTLLSLLTQSILMERRPRWMDFDRYAKGGYISALFKLFGIPESANNLSIANDHLKIKVNSSGSYDCQQSEFFDEGRALVDRLKAATVEVCD
jgi:hypothetical protein